MKRRIGLALVPALVVFLVVLAALFNLGIQAGVDWSRWSTPDWVGIGWPVGFPLFAVLVSLPAFLVGLAAVCLFDRAKRA